MQHEAHGAAHRRTRKYPKGPIQVAVVSRPARAPGQDGVRANGGFRPRFRGAIARSRRDLAICAVAALPAHGAARRRTRKYTKGPLQVSVVSLARPARAPGQEGVRANEGFRPRFRGAIARSRRDLAICAVAALHVHGATHHRARKSTQRVLYKCPWFCASHACGRDFGCAQNEDLSVTLDLICLSLPRSSDPWRREVERGLPTKVAKIWAHEAYRERKR